MRQRVFELRNAVLRQFAATLAVSSLVILMGIGAASAQSGTPAPDQSKAVAQPADAAKDAAQNQRRTDEFAEAAQVISGPAGNPECVWLGRRVVRLMWRGGPPPPLPPPHPPSPPRSPRAPHPDAAPSP